MCDLCKTKNNSCKEFKDKQLNTADYTRVLFIGQNIMVSGETMEQSEIKLIVKGGGNAYKVAQMLSSMFNQDSEMLAIFELAKELMPVMKLKTM